MPASAHVARWRLGELGGTRSQPEAKQDKDKWNDDLTEKTAPVSLVEDESFCRAGSARTGTT